MASTRAPVFLRSFVFALAVAFLRFRTCLKIKYIYCLVTDIFLPLALVQRFDLVHDQMVSADDYSVYSPSTVASNTHGRQN